MFSNLYKSDFVEIFILMLGSFLIGYFFAYYYFKNRLDNLNSNLELDFQDSNNEETEKIVEGVIKAKKTFERGGKEVAGKRQKKIDFNAIEGEPTLKKISKKKPTAKKANKKD